MDWGAVIVAAGKGRRMGSDRNKVYLPLGSQSVVAHTIQAFDHCANITELVIVISPQERSLMEQVLRQITLSKPAQLVDGGAERQISMYNGLCAGHTAGVVVHDAARPLIDSTQITACCEAAETFGAAVVAVPVKDTIKVVNDQGFITHTPKRDSLWNVQTPQAFSREKLKKAYRQATAQGMQVTDESMLFEHLHEQVMIVPGTYTNIKITTFEDLELAELLLRGKKAP